MSFFASESDYRPFQGAEAQNACRSAHRLAAALEGAAVPPGGAAGATAPHPRRPRWARPGRPVARGQRPGLAGGADDRHDRRRAQPTRRLATAVRALPARMSRVDRAAVRGGAGRVDRPRGPAWPRSGSGGRSGRHGAAGAHLRAGRPERRRFPARRLALRPAEAGALAGVRTGLRQNRSGGSSTPARPGSSAPVLRRSRAPRPPLTRAWSPPARDRGRSV